MPQPTSMDRIEEHVWMQVLFTIDVSALSKGTQFCNELGYDVEPILMISIKWEARNEIEALYWTKDEISIKDLSLASDDGYHMDISLAKETTCNEEDPWVDQESMNKIKELLSHRNRELGI